jgi:hypothetical protein
MCALLGPSRRTGPRARRRAYPESLAILSLQRTPIPQSPPLKFGNIVGRATTRLIGAVLLEQNDEWLLQHRYMQVEGMAELTPPLIDADPAKLPPIAALSSDVRNWTLLDIENWTPV